MDPLRRPGGGMDREPQLAPSGHLGRPFRPGAPRGRVDGLLVPGRVVDHAEDGGKAHAGPPHGHARSRGRLGRGGVDPLLAFRGVPMDAARGDPVGEDQRASGRRLHGGGRRLLCHRGRQRGLRGVREPPVSRGRQRARQAQPGVSPGDVSPPRVPVAPRPGDGPPLPLHPAVRQRRIRAAGHPRDGEMGSRQGARDHPDAHVEHARGRASSGPTSSCGPSRRPRFP